MKNPVVRLELTADEALILFDFLQRFSEKDALSIEHAAEERALWNLACLLEKELVEPFTEQYAAALHDARERLRDREE